MIWRAIALLGLTTVSTVYLPDTAYSQAVDAWLTKGPMSNISTRVDNRSARSFLPPETKVFEKGKDETVFLIVVFPDGDSHTVAVTLKGPSGLERPFNRVAESRGQMAWRYIFMRWPTANLEPGQYSLDVVTDDKPAGTYAFTLR